MAGTFNVKQSDLMLFYKRMASMSSAGHDARSSIRTLAKAGGKSSMGRVIRSINKDILEGLSTGEAMKRYLRHLSGLPGSTLERPGKELAGLYSKIAENVEREQALDSAAMKVTLYPAAVLTVAAMVVATTTIFVIPVFNEMFSSLGGELPLPTRTLILVHRAVEGILPLFIIGIAMTGIILKVNRRLRYLILDKVPFLGTAMRKVAVAEFMENYSAMSGVGLEGAEIVFSSVSAVTNDYLADVLRKVAHGTQNLGTMVMVLKKKRLLEGFVMDMLESGAATGTMESACIEAAPVLFDEAELTSRKFVSIATPLMLVTLGIVVGFIVISLYLPIFTIFSHIS